MSDDSPPSPGAYPPPPPPPPAAEPPEPPEEAPKPYQLRTRDKVIALSIGGLVLIGIIAAAVAGGSDDEGDTATATTETTEEQAETTEAPTTTTTVPPTTTTAAPTITRLSGGGDISTDPFRLDGGRYAVHYRFGGECFYGASLESPSGELVMVDLGTGTGPIEGDTNAYNVEAGDYYVRVITGPAPDCPWELTLTPAES